MPARTPPIAGAPIASPFSEVHVPVGGLDGGREGADDADRGERGAGGLALLVAEPEHQQRDDDGPASYAEEAR